MVAFDLAEQVAAADDIVEGTGTEFGQEFADFVGDVQEEVDDLLWCAGEFGTEFGSLGSHADGTVVAVAGSGHHTAFSDEGCGSERDFVGAKETSHDDIATGFDAAVDTHADSATQAVEDECLL
jgi:hypothetical protein